jgi:hypothetical protein
VRTAILVGAVIGAVVLLPSSAASGRQKPKPYVLTAFADIGTVYWRYDCGRHRPPRWSLGVRAFDDAATTTVTYRAGASRRQRTLQPGAPIAWFPFSRALRQRISLAQGTEPRTLYGKVSVRFGEMHLVNCWPYLPPRFTATLGTKPSS